MPALSSWEGLVESTYSQFYSKFSQHIMQSNNKNHIVNEILDVVPNGYHIYFNFA